MLSAGAALRQLAAAAASAPEATLRRLVRALDAMPRRGAADAVLAGARPRLRALRPDRPLTPQRLLFVPLDALLVDAARWRPEPPPLRRVPRSAVPPLAGAVREADPALASEIEALLRGRRCGDAAAVGEAGRRLWPAAAGLLPGHPPPGWEEAGLPHAAYAPIRALCAAALRHGPALWRLRAASEDGPPEALARELLAPAFAEGPETLAAALEAALPFAARPASLAAAVAGLGEAAAAVANARLDRHLESLRAELDPALPPAAAARAAERLAALAEDAMRLSDPARPKRALEAQRLRREAAQGCRGLVAGAAEGRLLAPLRAALAAPALSAAEVEGLEEAARALRALVDTAHGLDAKGRADPGLEEALRLLRGFLAATGAAAAAPTPGPDAAFGRADALRLVEILAGPEAAAQADAARG